MARRGPIYGGRKGKTLLYIRITNSVPRRMAEHQAGKDWSPDKGLAVPDRATAKGGSVDAHRAVGDH